MTAPLRDDSILLPVRIAHGVLALVVAPFAWILTVHPDRTAENFSWPLAPTMPVLFFGALYAAVSFGFLRVACARRWHEVSIVLWTTLPVLALLGLVSATHWDKFTDGPVRLAVWITAYFAFPPVLLGLILWNRRRASGQREPGDVVLPSAVKVPSLVLGLLVGLTGVALLVAPARMAEIWPWSAKPLAAQAIGCLLVAPAVAQIAAARETRWSALRIPAQAAIVWFTLAIAAVVRAFHEFDTSRPATWLFLAVLACEWALAVGTYAVLEARQRRATRSGNAAHPGPARA
jgi:hypothetical protein